MLQRETGKTFSQASIKSQASKNRFYGNDTIEAALGTLEGVCSAALRELVVMRNPMLATSEQIELVLVWIALQRSRTEAARQASKTAQDKMIRMMLEVQINNDATLAEESKQEMLHSLDDVESDPVQAQLMEMRMAMELAGALSDLTPLMLLNKTNRPFVFGDAPVVFYNGHYRNVQLRGALGFDTPGLMIFFPLSQNVTLALVDGACYGVNRARDHQIQIRDLRDVAALNKLQIHAASTCVYFHDAEFSNYVVQLWREEEKVLKDHAGAVVEAPGFDSATGEPLGDIVHSFQPQLPFRLGLSFLQHDVLNDHRYRFCRRSQR